jgi:G3E family GTPase
MAPRSDLNPAAEIFDGVFLGDARSLLTRAPPLSAPTARKLGRLRPARGHAGHHTPDVDSAAFTLDAPLEWSSLAVWLTRLLHAHGDRMLRFKALLGIQGSPAPIALDGVHHLIHAPRHLAAWPPGPRTSRLVFIAQGLQVNLIEPSLRSGLITARGGIGAGSPDTVDGVIPRTA